MCPGKEFSRFVLAGLMLTAAAGQAQTPDSSATVRLRAMHGPTPLGGVRVAAGDTSVDTGADGMAVLRLAPGPATLILTRIGYVPDTMHLSLSPGQETSLTVALAAQAIELEAVVVAATRSERRVEDTPLRVEVVDEEEVAEKVAMTPGDIAMMLNETSGLRVQTTSPSLGGASVRVQGLRGRYTLVLADGLPLYGGQAGGLGLLQIPPLDLARVEVIKGSASALYGSSALGGVVNLIARRPGEQAERQVLVNGTSRRGMDGVLFATQPLGAWGVTLLASAHRQHENDIDRDGWADMPGYNRLVLRPRVFHVSGIGHSLVATAGYTGEQREGGTLPGATAPDGAPYVEALRTRRFDLGVVGRIAVSKRDVLSLRGSAMEQRHRHTFGAVRETDRHRTQFLEVSYLLLRNRWSHVLGAVYQHESFATDVPGFAYGYRIPAAFAQSDVDLSPRVALSAAARLDVHSEYGVSVSPRVSLLLRGAGALPWTARVSGGGGTFAPLPFTEQTEVTGLTPLRPLPALGAERAVGVSLDVNGVLQGENGRVEGNVTVFVTRVADPIVTLPDTGTTPAGAGFLRLTNAPVPARTVGVELLLRLVRGAARVTASYAYTQAHEWDDLAGGRMLRDAELVPRHVAGVVASLEEEGARRVGVEVYYTGSQPLAENPYRATSRPFVIVGLLAEQVLRLPAGRARVFINAENVTNARQTRVDPLVLPARGRGGRWTTDVWSDLAGFTVNGGVKVSF